VDWEPDESGFDGFVRDAGPRLRHALIARYGPEAGAEALADALAIAWERWRRVSGMQNPAGWVYRVGQSRSRRYLRRPPRLPLPAEPNEPLVEPGLPRCLDRLTDKQRVAVLLVHAYGYTEQETAQVLGISPSTVHRNAERGLAHLRTGLGVKIDA
jgi:DNA-directed RNA polymerase specialized sigma24 family protein